MPLTALSFSELAEQSFAMAAHGDGREDFLLGSGLGGSPSSRPIDTRKPPVALYQELVTMYDQDAEDLRHAVDLACQALVSGSKVPEINACDDDPEVARDGAEGPQPMVEDEDERELQASVKKKFIEAMEQLQSTHVPKKRRGNLPKEATDTFRAWFSEHQEHPYPTDEEKKELAIKTNVRLTVLFNLRADCACRLFTILEPANILHLCFSVLSSPHALCLVWRGIDTRRPNHELVYQLSQANLEASRWSCRRRHSTWRGEYSKP